MLGSCNSGLSAANKQGRMAERLANSGLASKWQNAFIASLHFHRGTKGNKKRTLRNAKSQVKLKPRTTRMRSTSFNHSSLVRIEHGSTENNLSD